MTAFPTEESKFRELATREVHVMIHERRIPIDVELKRPDPRAAPRAHGSAPSSEPPSVRGSHER